jgi:phosphoribosylanthranilate isomerase
MTGLRVKVCGYTDPADARAAGALGVDFVGVVLVEASTRRASDGSAVARAARDGGAAAVAVVEDLDADALSSLAEFDVLQLHGQEPLALAKALRGRRFWKALRVSERALPALAELGGAWLTAGAEAVLLDGPRPGSGVPVPLPVLAGLARALPGRVVIAGGLGPDNVSGAVLACRPWCVDASSALELGVPGRKDAGRIAAYVAAARR